jgi:hypothetical protein
MKDFYIFKSSGIYLGFVSNGFIFSRDGLYLGWLEGEFAWDASGNFRGILFERNEHKYIVTNRFSVPPVPRSPKSEPQTPVLPAPPINIVPISLPVGFVDAF